MEDIHDVLQKNMKKYRQKNGVSQQALAELSDLSSTFIGEIEAGRRSPSLDSLVAISKALNVEPFQLLIPEAYTGNELIKRYNETLTERFGLILEEISSQL